MLPLCFARVMWSIEYVWGVVEGRGQFLKVSCTESPQTREWLNWSFNEARDPLLKNEQEGSWVVSRFLTPTGSMRYASDFCIFIHWFYNFVGTDYKWWIMNAGFDLQVLWGDLGGSCSCCYPQWSKDQLDLQPSAQTQRAKGIDICWKEIQRTSWKGTLEPQGTTFKKGYMEEEQHLVSSSLSLISYGLQCFLLLLWTCFCFVL